LSDFPPELWITDNYSIRLRALAIVQVKAIGVVKSEVMNRERTDAIKEALAQRKKK
jgi:hypothetical protein